MQKEIKKMKPIIKNDILFKKFVVFLIITIALSSCGKRNGKQNFYPCLNNYYMVEYLDDSIILMHGDLVFEAEVLDKVVASA